MVTVCATSESPSGVPSARTRTPGLISENVEGSGLTTSDPDAIISVCFSPPRSTTIDLPSNETIVAFVITLPACGPVIGNCDGFGVMPGVKNLTVTTVPSGLPVIATNAPGFRSSGPPLPSIMIVALSATLTLRAPVLVETEMVRPSTASTSPFTKPGAAAAGDGDAAGLAEMAGLAEIATAAGEDAGAAGDAAAGDAVVGAAGFDASVGFGAAVGAGGAPPQAERTSVPAVTRATSAPGARRMAVSSIKLLHSHTRTRACSPPWTSTHQRTAGARHRWERARSSHLRVRRAPPLGSQHAPARDLALR